MRVLLDTNVVSDVRKRNAPLKLVSFVRQLSPVDTYVSVLTLGEMRRGALAKRPTNTVAADQFLAWLQDLEVSYSETILPVTAAIAHRWGEMSVGRTKPVIDTLIAATADVHGLTLVTRNESDFRDFGVPVINPWA